MKDIEEILSLLHANKDYLKDHFKVCSITIYGSYSRNDQTKDSDVDIIVDFIEPIGWELVDLKDYLENILGLSVDLITRNAALNKKNFWEIIKNEIHYV